MDVDASELIRLGADLKAGSGRIGARAAAALRKAGYDIERLAKQHAPVDTGTLRSSISTKVFGDGRSGSMTVTVGDLTDYGLFVELGTSRMAPQPFMGPAFDAVVPSLTELLESAVEDAL